MAYKRKHTNSYTAGCGGISLYEERPAKRLAIDIEGPFAAPVFPSQQSPGCPQTLPQLFPGPDSMFWASHSPESVALRSLILQPPTTQSSGTVPNTGSSPQMVRM